MSVWDKTQFAPKGRAIGESRNAEILLESNSISPVLVDDLAMRKKMKNLFLKGSSTALCILWPPHLH